MRNNCAIEAKRFYNSGYTQMNYEDFMKKYRDPYDRPCIDAKQFTELAVHIISSFAKSFAQLNVAIPALCESIASSKKYRKLKKLNSLHIREMKREEREKEEIEKRQVMIEIAKEIKLLEEQFLAIEKEREGKLVELETDVHQLETNMRQLENAQAERRIEIDELETNMHQLETNMDELEKAQAERRIEISQLQKAQAERTIAIRELQINFHQLEKAQAERRIEISQLKTNMGELEKAQAERSLAISELETNVHQLEKAQAQRRMEIDELQKAQTERTIAISQLEKAQAERTIAIRELQTNISRLANLQAQNPIEMNQLEADIRPIEEQIFVEPEENIGVVERAKRALLLKVEESDQAEEEQVNEEVVGPDIQIENLRQESPIQHVAPVSEPNYPLQAPIQTKESISILQYLFKIFSRFPFESMNNLFNRLINFKK